MIELEEALRIVRENTPRGNLRVAPADEATGFVLARDVTARESIPLFTSSAMDGFALRSADVAGASEGSPVTLVVRGQVQAGEGPGPRIEPGGAVRIMTGAAVPEWADAVVKKEDADDLGREVRIRHAAGPGEFLRPRGGEFRPGDRILAAGTLVTPPVAGLLATVGCTSVSLFEKPRVALVVTGNELRSPGDALGPGQIRDANSPTLAAALCALGIEPLWVRRVGDDRAAIGEVLAAGLAEADVVISLGGVSVGDFDFVKEVAEELGVKTLFWRIAMKPGKPNYFGRKENSLLFGLPGNPVSGIVSFHKIVRPALERFCGRESREALRVAACLLAPMQKKASRLEFVPARLTRDPSGALCVTPFAGRDSHKLGGLARADCLVLFPRERDRIEEGETVDVEPLFWGAG